MTTLSSIGPAGSVLSQQGQAADPERAKLEKVAKQFEAVFVRQLMSSMRQGGFGDDLTGSSAVDQFQEMADANTADTLAERGSFGVAQMLVAQLGPKARITAQAGAAAAPAAQGGAE